MLPLTPRWYVAKGQLLSALSNLLLPHPHLCNQEYTHYMRGYKHLDRQLSVQYSVNTSCKHQGHTAVIMANS